MASNLTKPTAIPPHAPPANPEWPSKTGNPSGRNRGNAAPHSNSSKGSKKMKERTCITIFLFLCILISGVLSGCRAPEDFPQSSFTITISNTSGADLIKETFVISTIVKKSKIH